MIYSLKLIFLLIIYFNQAYSNELVNLRFGSNGEKNRIVLDLIEDASFDHKIYSKKIDIIFKKPIKIPKNFKTLNNLQSIIYDKKSNNLQLIFNKTIFSTNIYLLKKKRMFIPEL